MPEERWIDWPHDECPHCGGVVSILTSAPQDAKGMAQHNDEPELTVQPPYCWCGDKWRCEDGHTGVTYCDAETPVQLE